jgi:transcriptional regulator of arginine metabolism
LSASRGEEGAASEEDLILFAKAFLSLAFSGFLGVVKTLPGFANSLAAAIDKQQWQEVLGTVAGDDTILIVLKEGVSPRQWAAALIEKVPMLRDKINL